MRALGRGITTSLVAAALLLAACGEDDSGGGGDVQAGRPDGFEATSAYLAGVVDASTAQPYRFTSRATMGVDGQKLLDDTPVGSGEYDRHWTLNRTDVGKMLKEMARHDARARRRVEDLSDDIGFDAIANGQTIYLRATGFDQLAEMVRPGREVPPLISVLADLGDGWGRVDLGSVDKDRLPGEIASTLGVGQNMDPSFYLDLVAHAGDADDLHTKRIHGETMSGLAASVPITDLMKAQGIDPATFTARVKAKHRAKAADAIAAFKMQIETWIDLDGHVRRLGIDVGAGIKEAMKIAGEDDAPTVDFSVTIDFADYGDATIKVTPPASSVDVTDNFVAMEDDS